MSQERRPQASSILPSRLATSDTPMTPTFRKESTSVGSSTGSNSSVYSTTSIMSPRVQLVPYAHRLSDDSSFSKSEKDILDSTSFDAFDLSSQDFDFEDIFTYDKPQRKLCSVVEVSTPTREKDWSSFTFSHYPTAATIRQKLHRGRPGLGYGEKYVKKQHDVRKR